MNFSQIFGLSNALFLLLVMPSIAQNSIRDIINARGELSIVRRLLKGTNVFEKLGISGFKSTFFAPHNNAFGNLPEQLRSQLNTMNQNTANQIFLYHTVTGVTWTSNLTSTESVLRLQSLGENGPLFLFFYRKDTVYINGAELLEGDIAATNGILHIIDSIFVDLGPSLNAYKGNIDSYIDSQQQASRDQEKTTEFGNLLLKYDEYMSRGMMTQGRFGSLRDDVLKKSSALVTAFIPSDSAVKRFRQQNPDKYRDLTTGNAAILQRVLESHVIPNGAFHSGLLIPLTSNTTVPAMQGRIRMYTYSGSLYVSNNCARAIVTKANTTMDNGVTYMIDNIIGYIVNDLYNQTQRDTGISDFGGTILSAPSSFQALLQLPVGVEDVPEDKKFTVFAPNADAFRGNDFSQDRGLRLLQLNMTILRGMVHLDQMVNGQRRETLATGYFARFHQLSDGVYVDVDYVSAKIVEADICAKNGIIHKVDRILGVPARTVYEEILNNAQMKFLTTLVMDTGLKTLLDDTSRDVTMFAPNDDAVNRMSTDSPDYLNRQNESKLKNILLRHVGRGELFLDQIVPINGETTINTYNGELRIGNQNNEYYVLVGSQRIRVLQPDIRTKNGVLHIVDKVLYDPNDPRTAESTSGSNVLVPSSLLIISSLINFHLR